MTNDEMKPNRFFRWHAARLKIRWIVDHLNAGGEVIALSYTRCMQYDRRHVAMFKATRSGAYVRRGKSWDCIDFTKFQLSQLQEVSAAQ